MTFLGCTMKEKTNHIKIFKNPHILMIIYAVLVSLSFHVGHAITRDIEPVVLTFARFLLGSVLFGSFVLVKYEVKRPSISDLLRYTSISLSLVGYFLAMFYALRFTNPTNASVIYTIVPFMTAIFGLIFLKEFPKKDRMIVLLITMAGSAWVIVGGDYQKLFDMSLNKGDLIFLLGCTGMGLYPVLSKMLSRGEPTPVLTFWTLVTGAIVLGIAANVRVIEMDWINAPFRLYLGLGFITIFTTIVTFFIVQYTSQRMPVTKVMGYIYVIPVFVLIENLMLGHGFPEKSVIVGVIAVTVGTFYFMKD